MSENLEDVIERAAGLSKNGSVQITVRPDRTTVHFIDSNSGKLERTKSRTPRGALEKAIESMMQPSLRVIE